jgi:hypothetical protein
MKHYRKIEAEQLHYLPASDMHPANTFFHFSFANYCNPANMNFGVLRVLNDDDVKPESGFGKHSHEDMEIVSYVVKGKLTHWDSATNVDDTLERGNVQIVTAGTGVTHSELNKHKDWCRFLQIWILPQAQGLPVRYKNHKFTLSDRENKLLQIVGNPSTGHQVDLHLNQDVNLYVSELTDPEALVEFSLKPGRQAYVNCIEGSLEIKDYPNLSERDSLEISEAAELVLSAPREQAHFIIIEMPAMF